MKHKIILSALLLACFLTSTAAIRWHHADTPWFEVRFGGTNVVQLGLRDDGVVVWREVTNVTNSPAEKPAVGNWWEGGLGTNYWLTTNNVILLNGK